MSGQYDFLSAAAVWLDGGLVAADDPRLPSWHYGAGVADGVYDTWRTFEGIDPRRTFGGPCVALHLERLRRGCAFLRLELTQTDDELVSVCQRLIDDNGLRGRDARVRIAVSRRGVSQTDGPDPARLAVYALPVDQAALDGRRARGLEVVSLEPNRVPGDSFHQVKHLNGTPAVLARIRIGKEKVDDGLTLNAAGEVCEAVWSNVFLVEADGGALVTPAPTVPCLPGIVRSFVLDAARAAGRTVKEQAFGVEDLLRAGEAFATSSVSEVMPLVGVNGRPVGDGRPGPAAALMQTAVRRWAEG